MSPSEQTILEKLQHPYYMVIAGVLLWHLFVWAKSKASAIWWKRNAPTILASLLLGFSTVVWDDEWAGMIQEYNAAFHFKPYYYLLIGPATELVFKFVGWMIVFNPFKKT